MADRFVCLWTKDGGEFTVNVRSVVAFYKLPDNTASIRIKGQDKPEYLSNQYSDLVGLLGGKGR